MLLIFIATDHNLQNVKYVLKHHLYELINELWIN